MSSGAGETHATQGPGRCHGHPDRDQHGPPGWGIYNRLAQRSVASGERSPIAKVRPSEGLGEVRVDLPAGCAVVEMRPHADRLYLRTGPTGLCERIIVLDATSGQVLGTFVLRP